MLVPFAIYHYYTAGTGIPPEYWHMGIHLAGVLLMVFVCYPALHLESSFERHSDRPWRLANVPLWDWLFGLTGIVAPSTSGSPGAGSTSTSSGSGSSPAAALRQGNPAPLDIWMGMARPG